MALTILPKELIGVIFSYLSIEDLCTASIINRSFCSVTESFWKQIFLQIFVIDSSSTNGSEQNNKFISRLEFDLWKKELIDSVIDNCNKLEQKRVERRNSPLNYSKINTEDEDRILFAYFRTINPHTSWKSFLSFIVHAIKISTSDSDTRTFIKILHCLHHPKLEPDTWAPCSSHHAGALLHWLLKYGIISLAFVGQLAQCRTKLDSKLELCQGYISHVDFSDMSIFHTNWYHLCILLFIHKVLLFSNGSVTWRGRVH